MAWRGGSPFSLSLLAKAPKHARLGFSKIYKTRSNLILARLCTRAVHLHDKKHFSVCVCVTTMGASSSSSVGGVGKVVGALSRAAGSSPSEEFGVPELCGELDVAEPAP